MRYTLLIPLVVLASCSSSPQQKPDMRKEDREAIREDLESKGKVLQEYVTADNDLLLIHREGYIITKYRISDFSQPQKDEDGQKLPPVKHSALNALYSVDTNLKICKAITKGGASDVPCSKLKKDPDLKTYLK
jgi:hypothetical protein